MTDKPSNLGRPVRRRDCSWAEIKGGLDPAWSYVVVESSSVAANGAVFQAIEALLVQHAAHIRSRRICQETTSGHYLMLLKVAPERTAAIQRSLLGPRLPSSVTVFFYNHSPQGEIS